MKRIICAGLCLFIVTPVWAAVGELTPVAVESPTTLSSGMLLAPPDAFSNPKGKTGIVHARATVARLRSGKTNILAAIDSRTPDAPGPDVLRLDFTGRGNFNDEHVVPLTSRGSGSATRVGPGMIHVQRDGKRLPVFVEGWYHKQTDFRYLQLTMSTVMEGDCAFGDTAHRIRLIDGSGNLRVNDAARATQRGGRMVVSGSADTVQVDLADGTFTGSTVMAHYGQPVQIDGKWFKVGVSADGATVSAKPLECKSGQLQIDHDQWTATLANAQYVLVVHGGREPVTLPASTYQIIEFKQYSGEGRNRKMLAADNTGAKPAIARVVADKTAKVAVGEPIALRIKAKVRGRIVTMGFEMRDAAQLRIPVTSLSGSRSKPPRVTVRDGKGKIVHQGKFEFG